MQHITEVKNLKLQNTAIALGKFDGFHRGHQLLLAQVLEWQKRGMTGVIFTFAPAGRQIGSGKHIDSHAEKVKQSEDTGIQVLLEYPFSEGFANLQPEEFVDQILIGQLGVRAVAVGSDFHFGKHRSGDAELLKRIGQQKGFEVKIFEKLQEQEQDISSSVIREAIEAGDMERVTACLGHGYRISGPVVHGQALGRTIGIPTANQRVPEDKLVPPYGVYAARIHWKQKVYYGIANLGCKPTVSEKAETGLETYIFAFDRNIYGDDLEVELLHFLRREQKFENLDVLAAQMQTDIREAKKKLKIQAPAI